VAKRIVEIGEVKAFQVENKYFLMATSPVGYKNIPVTDRAELCRGNGRGCKISSDTNKLWGR